MASEPLVYGLKGFPFESVGIPAFLLAFKVIVLAIISLLSSRFFENSGCFCSISFSFLSNTFFATRSCSFTSFLLSESTIPSSFPGIPKTLSRKTFCGFASLTPISRCFCLQLLWKCRMHLRWVAFGNSVFQARNSSSSPSVMKPFASDNPLQLPTQVDANTLCVSKFFL